MGKDWLETEIFELTVGAKVVEADSGCCEIAVEYGLDEKLGIAEL